MFYGTILANVSSFYDFLLLEIRQKVYLILITYLNPSAFLFWKPIEYITNRQVQLCELSSSNCIATNDPRQGLVVPQIAAILQYGFGSVIPLPSRHIKTMVVGLAGVIQSIGRQSRDASTPSTNLASYDNQAFSRRTSKSSISSCKKGMQEQVHTFFIALCAN